MNHQNNIIILVVVAIITIQTVAAAVKPLNFDELVKAKIEEVQAINPLLEGIGSFDGKLYFTELTAGNWSDANKTCVDNSLSLVEVDSAEELSFLSLAVPPYNAYWTAATQVFQWNAEKPGNIDIAPARITYNTGVVENCVTIVWNYKDYVFVESCDTSKVTYPLCQVKIA